MTQQLRLIPFTAGALALTSCLMVLLGSAQGSALAAPSAPNEWRVCNTAGGFSNTIQSAVDSAQPGDVIKVAAGVYTESKGLAFNLFITKTVHLYGGYACNDWATRDFTANVVTIRPTTTAFSVVYMSGAFGQGAQFTPTLDGFTISGGGGGNHGGGLRLNDADALVRNNIITGNIGYLLGGGIYVQRGAPRIENNSIGYNRTTNGGNGGGIELEDTQATVVGNLIAGNVISPAGGSGGGIAVDGGGPVLLIGNSILSNTAAITGTGLGGGVYLNAVTSTLTSNLIQGNAANGDLAFGFGGGIYVYNSRSFTLTGNTIASNTAGYEYNSYLSGGGLEINSSTGILSGNVVQANYANGNVLFGNGGGIAAYTSTLTIQGGQVLNNKVSINCEGYGGGFYATNSAVSLDAVLIQNNCAANTPFYGLGGGLAFFNSPYTLTNVLIVNNFAFGDDTSVGGLFAGANSPGLMANNTVANNRGQGIRSASSITLTNNIIMSHTTGISLTAAVPVSVTFNDFYNNTTNQRGFSLGTSNIVINPQLDASFHLMPGSPAIDAGTRTNAPDHDIDGQPRPMIGTSGLYKFDIGADEFPGTAQTVRDFSKQPADFTLIGPGNPQDNPGSTGPNDWIGYAVQGADVNGDGKDDLIAGAPNMSDMFDGGPDDSGRVFALYNNGARRLGLIDLYTTTPSLEVRSWLNQQHIGQAFATGDLDGDGKRDLIVGASGAAQFNVTGTVYVFTGGTGLSGVRTLSPTIQAAYRFRSNQNTSSFGGANSLAAGHLHGGGTDDLVVGEVNATVAGRSQAGAVYVFFGSNSLPSLWDMSVLSPSLTIYGPAANAQLGRVVVADVNSDGQPDLIARSTYTVYVFYGPLAPGVIDLAVTPASMTIGGLADGRLAAGDVDGDGRADIIVGSGSQVIVLRGSTGGVMETFTGVTASAVYAADLNGDGKADIIIGEQTKGRVFVLNGGVALSGSADIVERADEIIYGENSSDQFGFSLSSGDLDGDGTADLIIGSRTHSVSDHPLHFEDAGAVYVLYGQSGQKHLYLPLVQR